MDIEEYQPPTRSKLFEHEDLIRAMRSKNWPFSKIIERLEKDHGLQITIPTLHGWCKRNGIQKGTESSVGTTAKPQDLTPRIPASEPKSSLSTSMTEDEEYEAIFGSDSEPVKDESPFSDPL